MDLDTDILKVHAPIKIKEIIAKHGIERVILAMPSASRPVKARLVRHLRDIGVEVYTLPSFAELVGDKDLSEQSVSAPFLGPKP